MAGEDIAARIMSFSQGEPGAICVFSACGLISKATLRRPNSSGGTVTYEGRYEILSLSGSLMPADNGGSRAGGIVVSLADPDGRVLGGGMAGLLVAETPVQVVLGSFLPGNHKERPPKRQRTEPVTPPVPAIPVSEGGYMGQDLTFVSLPPSVHTGDLPSLVTNEGLADQEADNNVSTEGESDDDSDDDDDGDSPSNLEIAG
uniref:AT-hook motif nuclear-localized protein n=1 Tax=Opuntia streptacantha TaxID=393608 RepID=A0A7C8YHB3_OPUST